MLMNAPVLVMNAMITRSVKTRQGVTSVSVLKGISVMVKTAQVSKDSEIILTHLACFCVCIMFKWRITQCHPFRLCT